MESDIHTFYYVWNIMSYVMIVDVVPYGLWEDPCVRKSLGAKLP